MEAPAPNADLRRAVLLVGLLNLGYFGMEFAVALAIGSVSLFADSIDYHGLFKCNLKRIADYPHLQAYMLRLLALPGVRKTVSLDHIKRGYYSVRALNPTGIVPKGPKLEWAA